MGGRGDDGFVVGHGLKIVPVLEYGLAVLGHVDDQGIEDNGDKAAGEAVVI